MALVGDNFSTSNSISIKLNIAMLGWQRHTFNLAVSDILSLHREMLVAVRSTMINFSHLVPAAKLRRFTSLKAKLDNVTSWRSSFQIVLSYQKLGKFLKMLDVC